MKINCLFAIDADMIIIFIILLNVMYLSEFFFFWWPSFVNVNEIVLLQVCVCVWVKCVLNWFRVTELVLFCCCQLEASAMPERGQRSIDRDFTVTNYVNWTGRRIGMLFKVI